MKTIRSTQTIPPPSIVVPSTAKSPAIQRSDPTRRSPSIHSRQKAVPCSASAGPGFASIPGWMAIRRTMKAAKR